MESAKAILKFYVLIIFILSVIAPAAADSLVVFDTAACESSTQVWGEDPDSHVQGLRNVSELSVSDPTNSLVCSDVQGILKQAGPDAFGHGFWNGGWNGLDWHCFSKADGTNSDGDPIVLDSCYAGTSPDGNPSFYVRFISAPPQG